jgi:glycogen debranching enzyme
MQNLADLIEDEVDYALYTDSHEKNFIKKYWTGSYLRDCMNDETFRPNQVIALSMEHSVIDRETACSIINQVDERLFTPYGLRTLDVINPLYKGRYEGGWEEREKAYHNGTVWPWLLGPYFKAVAKYMGQTECQKKWSLIQPLIQEHLWDAGIGFISEIFDGDLPHQPRGCVAQAWSMAELVRAYFEDVQGKKP